MAVTVYRQPQSYTTAYNQITYICNSDNAVDKYQLQLKIFIDDTLEDTIYLEKQPLPTGQVYFDVSKVVADYLSQDFTGMIDEVTINPKSYCRIKVAVREYIGGVWSAYTTTDQYAVKLETYIWNGIKEKLDWLNFTYSNYTINSGNTGNFLTTQTIVPISDNENAYLYSIIEDYSTVSGSTKIVDGTWTLNNENTGWTISNGTVITVGAPGLYLETNNTVANTTYTVSKATTCLANTWYRFDLVVASISDGATITMHFGTYSRTITDVGTYSMLAKSSSANDTFSIDMIVANNGDGLTLNSITIKIANILPYYVSYKTYDSSNNLLNEYIVKNNNINAGDKYKFLRLPSGTYNINQISNTDFNQGSQPIISANVAKYEVRYLDLVKQNYHGLATYNITDNCSKYTHFRLHWLNRLGGFDSYTFTLVSRRNQNVERKQFRKQLGALTFTNTIQEFTYNDYDSEVSTYSTKYNNNYTITSNWLSESESEWLSELLTSPVVYWDKSNTQSVAININTNTYQIFKKESEKIFNLQLDFTLSFDEQTQGL